MSELIYPPDEDTGDNPSVWVSRFAGPFTAPGESRTLVQVTIRRPSWSPDVGVLTVPEARAMAAAILEAFP